MSHLLYAALSGVTTVTLDPSSTALPGTGELSKLADGVDFWAMVAAAVGVLVGAILWAFGHYSQNYQQAYNGRRGVMVSALAAVLIGGAPVIINLLFHQGQAIK